MINSENESQFAVRIEHNVYITKKQEQADTSVIIGTKEGEHVQIFTKLQDPNNTHSLTLNKLLKEVERRLSREPVKYKFNRAAFMLFDQKFGIKENQKYCYVHVTVHSPARPMTALYPRNLLRTKLG